MHKVELKASRLQQLKFHYIKKDWLSREALRVQNKQCIDSKNILLSPQLIDLGVMENILKSIRQDTGGSRYL